MLARKLDNVPISSIMQQMWIVSDCLLWLGRREDAIAAQRSENWEHIHSYVKLIKDEATKRKDGRILNHLDRMWLTADKYVICSDLA